MDRLLGNTSTGDVRVLEQVEDQEDVAAAKIAQQEIQLDDQDFEEKVATGAATPRTPGTETPAEELPSSGFGTTPALEGSAVPEDHAGSAAFDPDEVNAWGAPIVSIDDYMLKIMSVELKDAPLPLPKDKSKSKKGKDHRHRSHRAR
jgi:helicase SWR1